MTDKIFPNGLASDQIIRAKSILKKVNLKKICADNGVSYSIVINVLRGTSPRLECLRIVLDAANVELQKRDTLIQSF
ncbi:hypothetical protein LX64_04146 [Chitinophaga skermanii]|uniref:Helix-turn-helix protein n=1 Tax=Chitinophaga skermanii TaxID=331697 RepID=A0A327Q7R3_9BACT|nr:hypothetical protein LX64_04146 [Chitinophaga skermanii]